jgi:crossover junction endodeoxyribonuclease RuvC
LSNTNSSEEYIIFAVDPGTIVTGYALVKLGKNDFIPIDFGCIRPPKNGVLSSRYHVIFQSLCHLIRIHRPTEMAIETPFIHKNPQSALKLGSALGCALIAAKEHNLSIFGYSPREVKQGITGLGGASKEDVGRVLCAAFHLPLPIARKDASDALSIAVHHGRCRALANSGIHKLKEL